MPGDIVVGVKPAKKAKRVVGEKAQMKALKELRDVNDQIQVRDKAIDLRFEANRKLFDRRRKLQEQLGI
jgi:hypothetical protein